MPLLHLDSSGDLTGSRSRAISATFADAWRAGGGEVVHRDLHRDPPPHLPDPALHWPAAMRPDATPPAAAEALQRELVEELLAADALLVASPLYNWTVPSTLKAWIDHIHVPGVTTHNPEVPGPLHGRPAVVVVSRGATYDPGTPTEHDDHAVAVLRRLLGGSLGMTVEVITVSRTLAGFVPLLDGEQERAAQELAAAHAAARELGEKLVRA